MVFSLAYTLMSEQWNVYENFQALFKAGIYHLALEVILILWIIWLIAKKPNSKNIKLSKKEEQQLLAEWTPEPLIDDVVDPSHPALTPRVVDGKVGLYINVDGKDVLNFASHNYLNMSSRPEIEEFALECLHQYGVGSCGPRGFYGTTEVHLQLEDKIAEFYHCEMAVLYSYGFSTIASAIPAYSKSGDIIYADEFVNFAIQRGMDASRSKLVYFRHNDVDHLESLLKEQEKQDRKEPKKAAATRRFLVVEGIYMNTGTICPLPDLVRIRAKYKLRLFIDESVSFGTLGSRGAGVIDHFNIPRHEVDMVMAGLETAAASSGGFTVGTKFVVDHQRLNGLGYCFSASLPPMLAAASIKVIEILEKEGNELVLNLQETCRKVHEAFAHVSDKIVLCGDLLSPVKHLRFSDSSDDRSQQEALFRLVVQEAQKEGVAFVMAAHLKTPSHDPPPPSIRIAVNKSLSQDQIHFAAAALRKAFKRILGEK